MDIAASVDLGATNLRCALMTEDGGFLCFQQQEVSGIKDGSAVTSLIADMIEEMSDAAGVHPSCIGISAAGPVDVGRGAVVHSPNMSASEIELTGPLSEKFGVPAFLLTDCKAAVLGEYMFGGGSGVSNLVYLTFSTGIGCGVLQDGVILSGADGNAGEAGHFLVDTEYAVPCGCGGAGHWEAYCSGTGIPKFFAAWNKKHGVFSADECSMLSSAKDILSAAYYDERVRRFVSDVSLMNVRGMLSVICAYNPEKIILDGPLARGYYRLLFSEAVSSAGCYLRAPEFEVSMLSGTAPLLGAGAYAMKMSEQNTH
ncbi:MAG TPA: ROK family protein [Methanocorpusculum sp.]|nr:ROK family protein [Methanocorpusculum sp.]